MPESQVAGLPNASEIGPTIQSPTARSGRRVYGALDSWRGICACMVALAHIHTVGQTTNWLIIRHSYLFVDFFFVLSGFIIFENYYDRIKNGFSIPQFMFLRFGRLYPLHLFMLFIIVITELKWLGMSETMAANSRAAFTGVNSGDAFVSQLLLLNAMSINEADTWNVPSWSIGAEFYTYLVFALIIWCSGSRIVVVTIAISLIAAVVLWSSGHPTISITHDLGLIRCIVGFGIGALCSRMLQWRVAPPSAPPSFVTASATSGELIVLALTIVFVIYAGDNRLSYLAPFVFAAAVLVFAQEAGAVSGLLRTRPFRFLGMLSYSIYMMHYLAVTGLTNAIRSAEPLIGMPLTTKVQDGSTTMILLGAEPWQGNIAQFLMLIPVILISFVTYRLVEVPARRWSRRIAPRIRL